MFDVEQEAGQTYAVQIAADDPHRLEAREAPLLFAHTSWTAMCSSPRPCRKHEISTRATSWVAGCLRVT